MQGGKSLRWMQGSGIEGVYMGAGVAWMPLLLGACGMGCVAGLAFLGAGVQNKKNDKITSKES